MTKDKPFIVASEKAFGALPRWLKERGCNTYNYNDEKHIQVGFDAKPNSDWGRYTNCGYIVVTKPELFEATCKAIEQAYGWPP